jgi:hypothetical protein
MKIRSTILPAMAALVAAFPLAAGSALAASGSPPATDVEQAPASTPDIRPDASLVSEVGDCPDVRHPGPGTFFDRILGFLPFPPR